MSLGGTILGILAGIVLAAAPAYAYEFNLEDDLLREQWQAGFMAEKNGNLKTAREVFKAACKHGGCDSCRRIVELELKAGNTDFARVFFPSACDCSAARICVRLAEEAKLRDDIPTARKYYRRGCQKWGGGTCAELSALGGNPVRIQPAYLAENRAVSEKNKQGGREKRLSGMPAGSNAAEAALTPEIYIYPPVALDWVATAQASRGKADLNNPSQKLIDELKANTDLRATRNTVFFELDVSSDTARDAQLEKKSYVLFSLQSVAPLAPGRLRSAVIYHLSETSAEMESVSYSGRLPLFSRAGGEIRDGGFVFVSDSEIMTSTSPFTESDKMRFITTSKEKERFKSAYKIHLEPGNVNYVFISWSPPKMGVGCEKEYDIYEVSEPASVVPKIHVESYGLNCGN
jgi:hypothetical protein